MRIEQEEDIRDQQSDPVRKYALKLLKRWPLILLLFLGSLAIGFAINRYSTPVYLVKARITTKKFSNKPSSPIPGLVDASFFLAGSQEVYEEIPILKSPRRIEATVDKLDFRVSYFSEGEIKTTESLNGFGYEVTIDTIRGNSIPYGIPVFVNYLDSKTFELDISQEFWTNQVKGKKFRFGEQVLVGQAVLRVVNKANSLLESDKYYFTLNSRDDQVNQFRNRLNIQWTTQGSAMLDLSMESELPDREIQFLNSYFDVVQEFAIREKMKPSITPSASLTNR